MLTNGTPSSRTSAGVRRFRGNQQDRHTKLPSVSRPGNQQSFHASTWTHVYTDGSSYATSIMGEGESFYTPHTDTKPQSRYLLDLQYFPQISGGAHCFTGNCQTYQHRNHLPLILSFWLTADPSSRVCSPPADSWNKTQSTSLSLSVHENGCTVDPCTRRLVRKRGGRQSPQDWQPFGAAKAGNLLQWSQGFS